jgi:hypothetical protein
LHYGEKETIIRYNKKLDRNKKGNNIMGFFKNLEIDVQDLVFSYFDEDGVMIAGENKESILEDVSDLLGVSAVAMAAEEIDLITTRQHVDFLGGSI